MGIDISDIDGPPARPPLSEEKGGWTVTMRAAPLVSCFIETMRPVTSAETAAWRFYLGLHRDYWPAARTMFRLTCEGEDHGAALLRFIVETGLNDSVVVVHLETVLRNLAVERIRLRHALPLGRK